MSDENVLDVEASMTGKFVESLKRSNKQIKQDRAEAIGEDTYMALKREVEDLAIKLKRLQRESNNLLDLSPENALSLKLATDFDAQAWVDKYLQIKMDIYQTTIKKKVADQSFEELFGGKK